MSVTSPPGSGSAGMPSWHYLTRCVLLPLCCKDAPWTHLHSHLWSHLGPPAPSPVSLGGARSRGGKVVDWLEGRCPEVAPREGVSASFPPPGLRPPWHSNLTGVRGQQIPCELAKQAQAWSQTSSRLLTGSPTLNSTHVEAVEPPLVYQIICWSLLDWMLPEGWNCACPTLHCIWCV